MQGLKKKLQQKHLLLSALSPVKSAEELEYLTWFWNLFMLLMISPGLSLN